MPEKHDGTATEPAGTADDCRVLTIVPVAGQRREIGDELFQIVREMRPVLVARDLGLLPGRQLAVDLFERGLGLLLELADLIANGNAALLADERAQLDNLVLELGHRLFEIEIGSKLHSVRFRPP